MLYAIVAVLALIVDQLVKYWTTVKIVVDTGEAKLIPGFIHLANVHNTGAAFSFLEGARWFFVVLCILFVAVVVYVLAKNIIRQPLARWMAVLVMAGAIGNCIDRIVCGYVVDMFEFEFVRFPVFNVADIYITVGAVIFCICILLEKPAKKTAEASPAAKTAAPASAAPAAAKAAPAPAKKPLLRKHKKVEVPDFPKRAPAPAAPAIDPNDPFAEWEKRAAAAKAAPAPQPAAPQQPQQTQPTRVVYSEPVMQRPIQPQQVQQPAAPAQPAHHAAAHHEPPQHAAHHETPAAAPVQQPAAPVQPAAPAADSAEFDLDSILAEFKDL